MRPETIRCPDADHPPAYSPSLPSEIFLHFFPYKNQFWSLRKYILPSQDHNSGSCTAASSEHSVPDCQYSPILALACIQRSDRMPFFDSYSTSSAASPSLSAPEAPANAPYFSHEPALSPHRSKPPLWNGWSCGRSCLQRYSHKCKKAAMLSELSSFSILFVPTFSMFCIIWFVQKTPPLIFQQSMWSLQIDKSLFNYIFIILS